MAEGSSYLERAEVTDPRTTDLLEYEHRARYEWAVKQLRPGAEVLDIACGTGHGSELIASVASVTGVDYAEEAIERADARSDGTFIKAEVPPIPLGDESFDAIVSFETIEHIERDGDLIAEFARVLKDEGVLIISSPNAEIFSPDGEVGSEFHFREYELGPFEKLLEAHGFEVLEVLGQGRELTSSRDIWRRRVLLRFRGGARFSERFRRYLFDEILDRAVRPMERDERPAYWVLRCRLSPQ